MVRWGDPKQISTKALTREDALERGFVPARVSWENYEGECCNHNCYWLWHLHITQEIRMWLQNERMDIDKNLSSVLNKLQLTYEKFSRKKRKNPSFQAFMDWCSPHAMLSNPCILEVTKLNLTDAKKIVKESREQNSRLTSRGSSRSSSRSDQASHSGKTKDPVPLIKAAKKSFDHHWLNTTW